MSRVLRGVAAVALVGPVLVATVPAHAAVLTADDILKQFNAVVANNFSTNSDVEGRLVAGNINNGGSSTFYEKPNRLECPLVVSGRERVDDPELPGLQRQQWRRRELRHQQFRHIQFEWRGSVSQNNPSFAMSDFTTPLNALQAKLATMVANSNFTTPNNNSLIFNVTPDASGTAIFDMTAAELAGGPGDNYNITFSNETSASTIIINVTGSFTEGGGENFNGDAYLNEHVIWNFEDATGSASSSGTAPSSRAMPR